MKFEDLIKEREAFADKSQSQLEKFVKQLQSTLYSALLDKVVSALATDAEGKIKFDVGNIKTANGFSGIWSTHQKQTNKFVQWIIKKLIDLFDLNTKYVSEISKVSESFESKTRRLLLLNLGYDLEKNQIVPNSWLANLSSQDEVKTKIANRIATAIQSGTSLKQFRNDFRDDFLNSKTGLGYLERYFNQRSFDLFQKFDRSASQVYAKELKLNWRIYSGTIMEPVKGKTKGTRPFCRARVQNIYSTDEIEKWRNLEFSGRVDPYDPFIDCGSANCRHHWSPISDEIKEVLEKRGRKVNEYNKLPPGQTLTKY